MLTIVMMLILSLTTTFTGEAELVMDDLQMPEGEIEVVWGDDTFTLAEDSSMILMVDSLISPRPSDVITLEHYYPQDFEFFLADTQTTWNYMIKSDTLFLESEVIMYNGVRVLLIPLSHPEFM